jgi:TRAP-type C4-dicarboxylate transport system permease small subunit
LAWLRRRAEDVAAALLAAMFAAFVVQVFMRYVLNSPVGWSTEICTIAWLWGILWGSSLVLRDSEEIRFDVVCELVGNRTKRLFTVLSSAALVVLYGFSLPATIDYISFMQVEKSAYLGIRFDYLFSIYIVFAVASIVRHLWMIWRSIRGETSGAAEAGGSGHDA